MRIGRSASANEPMQRFESPEQAQRFLQVFSAVCNHFRPRRHRLSGTRYRLIMQSASRNGGRSQVRRRAERARPAAEPSAHRPRGQPFGHQLVNPMDPARTALREPGISRSGWRALGCSRSGRTALIGGRPHGRRGRRSRRARHPVKLTMLHLQRQYGYARRRGDQWLSPRCCSM
jgi:hypothetical protein